MKANKVSICATSLLVSFLCPGCIFPYDDPVPAKEWALVVDGDLLIGEETLIRLGRLNPLDGKGSAETPIWALCWVEDSEGVVYRPLDFHQSDTARIDLSKAPLDREYRLHIAENFTRNTYVSSWRPVQQLPVLDSVSFRLDSENNAISVCVSLTGKAGDSPYVQVDYREQWQFHSPFIPALRYVPDEGYCSFTSDYPYWCWRTVVSQQPALFQMLGKNGDKAVDHVIQQLALGAEPLQKQYAIDVLVRPLSQEAYLYRYETGRSSDKTGDLFSPTPSRMKGNITCENDPSRMAIGYVDVTQSVRARRLLLNPSFYRDYPARPENYPFQIDTTCKLSPEEIQLEIQPYRPPQMDIQWWNHQYYAMGMIPYWKGVATLETKEGVMKPCEGIIWLPEYCADCVKSGGSLLRPADWPEDE